VKSIDIVTHFSLIVKYFHKLLKKVLTNFAECYIIITEFHK